MKQPLLILLTAGLFMACSSETKNAAREAARETQEAAGTLVTKVASGGISGVYAGVIPCADCAGIETHLYIYPDSTYTSTSTYLGKGGTATESGKWSSERGTVILSGSTEARKLRMGLNKLILLDGSGNEISGSLKDRYTLSKIGDF